jgi:tetratricopeptide (TPR) repeat protein
LPKHDKDEYFLELDLLLKLQKVLNCEQIVSIPNAIMILQQALEVFAEYAGNVQLQHQIQGYGYCLQQQYEYVKFFASVCGVELPDHAKIAAELITACHAKVTKNLEYQVSSLPIDEDKLDQVYYHKAIKYLEDYPDSPACKNLKAIAYSCVASIAEQNGENGALAYYVKAIEANSHLPKIYEKVGSLFFNKGEYTKAIDCYKVVNNEFEIKACFKAWLEQDKRNPDIMLK